MATSGSPGWIGWSPLRTIGFFQHNAAALVARQRPPARQHSYAAGLAGWLRCRPASRDWYRRPRRGVDPPFNDDAEKELGAPTPRTPSTTRCQASPSIDRQRLVRHTHRKCRSSPRPASPVHARCDPTHARAPRQHRWSSSGSRPQRCHHRSVCRSSPHCQARDAPPAPPTAGGHEPDALSVERERRRGRDHWMPPPYRTPRVLGHA